MFGGLFGGGGGSKLGTIFVDVMARTQGLARGFGQAEAMTFRAARRMQAAITPVQKIFLTGLAIAPGASLFGITKIAANFEQEMARVKALSQATEREFENLKSSAIQLGKETVFTSQDAARAMSFFALAGFKTDEIIGAMPATLDLAAAGAMDVAQAADIAAKIMRGMGIETKDLGHTFDVLTKTMTSSNTDLVQLGEAFKFAGPVSKQFNRSIEETAAAIGVMSDAGMQGSLAGTSLRNILLRLSGEGGAQKVFDQMGFSATTADGKFKHLADIVDELNVKFKDMNETQKAQATMGAFGLRGGPAIAALLEAGGDKIREFERSLINADGTAKRVAETQMNTLKGAWEKMKGEAEALALSIGEKLIPALTVFSRWLESLVASIQKVDPAWVQFTTRIAAWTAGIAAAIIVVPKLIAMLVGLGKVAVMLMGSLGPGGLVLAIAAVALAFTKALPALAAYVEQVTGLKSLLESMEGGRLWKMAQSDEAIKNINDAADPDKNKAITDLRAKGDKFEHDAGGLKPPGMPAASLEGTRQAINDQLKLVDLEKKRLASLDAAFIASQKSGGGKKELDNLTGHFVEQKEHVGNAEARLERLKALEKQLQKDQGDMLNAREGHAAGLLNKLGINLGRARDMKDEDGKLDVKGNAKELGDALGIKGMIETVKKGVFGGEGPLAALGVLDIIPEFMRQGIGNLDNALKGAKREDQPQKTSFVGIEDLGRSIQSQLGDKKERRREKEAKNVEEIKVFVENAVKLLGQQLKVGKPAVAS